jgi:hypothetical protein
VENSIGIEVSFDAFGVFLMFHSLAAQCECTLLSKTEEVAVYYRKAIVW